MTSLQRRVTRNSYPFNTKTLCPGTGPSAAERLALAQQASQCVDWLFISGFEVLQVTKGLDKPRVFIRNSPLCKKLNGVIHRYERSKQSESRYWFTIRFDCEVRWVADEACLSADKVKS